MSEKDQLLQNGRKALESKDYETAEKIFSQMLDVDSVGGKLWLSRVYCETHRAPQGEMLLKSILEASESDAEQRIAALVGLGRIKMDADDFQPALEYFSQAYELGNKDVLSAMTACHSRLDHHAEAERLALEAISLGMPDAHEMLGDVYMNSGNWQGAVAQLQDAYAKNKNMGFKLGIALMHLKRNSEAVPYLKEALKQGHLEILKNLIATYICNNQNRNAVALGKLGEEFGVQGIYSFIGIAYKNMKDWPNALKYLKLGIKKHEPLQAVYFNIALCHTEMGEYKKALAALTQSAKQKDDGIWNTRGHIYWKMGDLKRAIKAFKTSTECEPNLALLSSFSLGRIYRAQGDDNAAAQYFQDAWSGGFLPGGIALGDYAFTAKDYKQAAKWYQKALDNGYQDALYPLAHAHRLLGHFDQAREMFLRCIERGDERARIGLALTLTAERKYDEVVPVYEMSVEHHVEGANKFFGRFLADRGDFFAAIAYLKAAWEEDKETEVLKDLASLYFKAKPPLHSLDKVREYTELYEREQAKKP